LLIDITAVDSVEALLTVDLQIKTSSYIYIVTTLVSLLYETCVQVVYPLCKEILSGVTSLMSLYVGACAFEREVWDMFGVRFFQHSDLRRIISDYGLKGFPLLKSFPVTGHYEIRYDCADKRIISYPLELTQGFRSSGDLVKFDVPRFT
jgi:NADH:ubiquinone oxidoreductase subunit C